jgi:butyrate kinase
MPAKSKILIINPGSTSTKIAVYEGDAFILEKTIRHYLDELVQFPSILSQYQFRKQLITSALSENGIALEDIKVIMGRGGLTFPLESGVYEVDERMLSHLRTEVMGSHASNLAPIISYSLASDIPGAKAYISDPVVTDELQGIARITGHPRFERRSIFHALNQKAVARLYAHSISKKYYELNLIVVHMGGGVSIGAHHFGRVIDVNNALDGEGPFSPERSGTIPVGQLIEECFSGQFSKQELKRMINGQGGMVAYLDTNSMADIVKMAVDGDSESMFFIDAFVYQVSKSIGEMAVVLKGRVDAILLTGGVAFSKLITDKIDNYVRFIAPIHIYPGEDEMRAMAMNAVLMLSGELLPKKYPH